MRSLHVARLPFRSFNLARPTYRPASPSRTFSVAPQVRLREGEEKDPEDLEQKKQQARQGEKPRDLQSAGEEAVGADQEKVKDNKKHMEELQKQTANESQKNHPKGQS